MNVKTRTVDQRRAVYMGGNYEDGSSVPEITPELAWIVPPDEIEKAYPAVFLFGVINTNLQRTLYDQVPDLKLTMTAFITKKNRPGGYLYELFYKLGDMYEYKLYPAWYDDSDKPALKAEVIYKGYSRDVIIEHYRRRVTTFGRFKHLLDITK